MPPRNSRARGSASAKPSDHAQASHYAVLTLSPRWISHNRIGLAIKTTAVGTDDDSDHQCEREGMNSLATEPVQQHDHDQRGDRCQQRSAERLIDTVLIMSPVNCGALPLVSRIRSKTTIVSFSE